MSVITKYQLSISNCVLCTLRIALSTYVNDHMIKQIFRVIAEKMKCKIKKYNQDQYEMRGSLEIL